MAKQKKFLQNPQQYFNTLNLIYYFMVAGPLAVFTYFYLKFAQQGIIQTAFPDQPNPLVIYVIPLATIGVIGLAYLIYRHLMHKIDLSLPLAEKLSMFARHAIVKYAFLEVASLLIVAGFALSKLKFYIVLYVITLVVFSFHRPTQRRVGNELKLNKEEKEKLWSEQDFEQ